MQLKLVLRYTQPHSFLSCKTSAGSAKGRLHIQCTCTLIIMTSVDVSCMYNSVRTRAIWTCTHTYTYMYMYMYVPTCT